MSNPTSTNRCPACGGAIPEGAPQGLCPKCLLAGVGQPQESAAPASSAHSPPPLAEVAAAFPQLEIVELIGMGGMGCVFKARQPKLERFVALKLLPAKFAVDPSFRERFSREARVLARLNHPSIVSVFDFGEAGGFFYLLMEYVDGANLRQAMQAGRFTPDQALAIVPKICEALQFAHSEGILHRDVKPENILLDTKGRVKIADFGIAKLVGEPQAPTQLTATGAAIGTPQYMAPEQIEHPQDVDHRADIYSLGVVFYEMLTGELPIGRFAPPSQKTPVDPRVDEVVLRALEKEREKRYQSAGEVKTRVEHLTARRNPPGASAAAPGFSPADDFILCPPGLPRMAKAIIVYALLVAPLMWFVGLFTFETLPKHEQAAFIEGAFNVLSSAGDFVLVLLLAIGGWRLRGLHPAAPGWLKGALWLHLGFFAVALAGLVWVVMVVEELVPDGPIPSLGVRDGVLLATALATRVFEIGALVWLHRHAALMRSLCQAPPLRRGPHGTMVLGPAGAAEAGGVPKWSRASIVGASLAGLSLPAPAVLAALLLTGMGDIGPWEVGLALGGALLLGLPGTILGWVGLSDVRAYPGRLRGLPLAVFAALAWPVFLLVLGTLVVPLLTTFRPPAPAAPSLASPLWMLVPAGALTFAVWSVYATTRWGSNQPLGRRRGVVKWLFAMLLLALAGFALARLANPVNSVRPMAARIVEGNAEVPGSRDERAVTVTVSAPPRECLVISATVLSNRVPIAQPFLRTKQWPAGTTGTTDFQVKWESVVTDGASSWDIEVTSAHDGQILARLCPDNLPQFRWSGVPVAPKSLTASREAREMEVARALRRLPEGTEDWSVRLKIQSQPPQSTDSRRGMEADFVLPANQVAVFEVVTRTNGAMLPVPGLAAHVVNGGGGPWKGKFVWADNPEDLDGLTALPRWSFGIIGTGNRLLETGLGVPMPPAKHTGWLTLWTELKPDEERLEGMSATDTTRPAYGLRIRTQTVKPKPGLIFQSSGFGTNWMKDAAQHLESASANAAAWIRFTFTAVELRNVGGTNWLAVDYVDDVHGACSKAFPWECTLPGAKPEVRTTEFVKDDRGSPAVRHQRIEYRLPDSVPREQLERWRADIEKTLKQKSVRLGLGEKHLLFGVSTTEGFSINAWVEVKSPLPESP